MSLSNKEQETQFVLDQAYDALRIAANILQARTRETAADRQIEFAERLVKWARDGQKETMPTWIPDHEPEPIKVYFRSEVESCIKDSLQEAAENLKFTLFPGGEQFVYPHVISHSDLGQQVIVDKSSITDTKNIKIK